MTESKLKKGYMECDFCGDTFPEGERDQHMEANHPKLYDKERKEARAKYPAGGDEPAGGGNLRILEDAEVVLSQWLEKNGHQPIKTSFDLSKSLEYLKDDPQLIKLATDMKAAMAAVKRVPDRHQEITYILIAAFYVRQYADTRNAKA